MPRVSTYREFPFCQENYFPTAAVPASRFPFSMTKDKLFEWVYRIKKWNFDFNLVATGSGKTITLVGNVDVLTGIGTPYGNETDLACNVGADIFSDVITSGGEIDFGTPPVDVFDIYCYLAILVPQGSDGYPDYYPSSYYLRLSDAEEATPEETENNLYLPSLFVGISTSTGVIDLAGSGNNSDGEPTITATIDGFSVPFWLVTGDPPGFTLTGSMTITPVEWWEHDPEDGGGPVWDATDGSQLRDPLTC